jgi:23S rRNA pseudouridine2605 synthase
MEAKPERLQKILAAAGLASRRKAEQLIAAGIVSVNGHVVTEPGTKADPRIDEIRVDGKLLRGPERHVYLAVYKPKGHMTTVSDPEGRPTVMDLLKGVDERVFPVGRLDYMSEGLLLLTNDGDLMAELTKAGSHIAKTYMVKVSGKPSEEEIDKLRNGIMLPPEPGLTGVRGKKQPGTERRSFAIMTQPAAIQLAVDQENPWYEVTLTEGRNRQIRRMFEQIGYHIEKIKRVRYGSLTLDVEPGEFRHLTTKEVNQLRKSMDTPFKPKPIKVKRKDDRPERRPRVDAARFVKGRRGKPSADAPVPAPMVRRGSFTRPPASPRREFSAPAGAPHLPQSADMGSPRGPEFSRPQFDRNSARRDDGFAAKRPYTRKPAGEFSSKPSGDFAERPKRTYAKPAGSFDRKPGSFDRKPSGDFAKREGGREGGYVKRPSAKREGGFGGAPEKRTASGTDGFGFSKFAKPKFVKPSKHRDLGSDKTENFEHKPLGESKPFGERKPFDAQRPYSKPAGDRSFDKKPGGFTSDRKYSKGPGKPAGYAPRSGGDYKPRSGGSSDFKRPGGDFKRSGEGRPGGRPGGFGKSAGPGRSSSGGAGGRPSGGSGFGAKRTGFGPPRSGSGGARRPSGPPRRRPDSE